MSLLRRSSKPAKATNANAELLLENEKLRTEVARLRALGLPEQPSERTALVREEDPLWAMAKHLFGRGGSRALAHGEEEDRAEAARGKEDGAAAAREEAAPTTS